MTRNPTCHTDEVRIDPDPFSLVVGVAGLISCVESALSLYSRLRSRPSGQELRSAQTALSRIEGLIPHVAVDLHILRDVVKESEIPEGRSMHLGREAFIRSDDFRRFEQTVDALLGRLRQLTKLTFKLERTLGDTRNVSRGQLTDIHGRLQRVLRDPDETIDQALEDTISATDDLKRIAADLSNER